MMRAEEMKTVLGDLELNGESACGGTVGAFQFRAAVSASECRVTSVPLKGLISGPF